MTLRAALVLVPLVLAACAPQTAAQIRNDTTLVRLSESAQREVTQDRLHAYLRVEAAGADATAVQNDINRRMATALERSRNRPNIQVETQGYYVNQERPQNGPVQWRGMQSMTLTSKDTAALLALTGELQQTGLVLSNLSYDLSPEAQRAIQDELTTEALRRLRERGERVAATLGATVQRIQEIRIGEVGGGQPPRPVAARALAAGAAGFAAPSAEPGQTTVQVNVEADIAVGPRTP